MVGMDACRGRGRPDTGMTNATTLPLPALATQQQMTQDEDAECAEGDGDKGLPTGLAVRGSGVDTDQGGK